MESNSSLLHPKYNVRFFLTKVFRYFIDNNKIFTNLYEHTLEQIGIDNHIVYLFGVIATKYIQITLYV